MTTLALRWCGQMPVRLASLGVGMVPVGKGVVLLPETKKGGVALPVRPLSLGLIAVPVGKDIALLPETGKGVVAVPVRLPSTGDAAVPVGNVGVVVFQPG